MTAAEMGIAIVRVAVLALLFGSGIPVLYSLGMRAMTGDPIYNSKGELVGDTEASPQMKALGWAVYAALAVLILIAIMWVAKGSLEHYFGFTPFGSLGKSGH